MVKVGRSRKITTGRIPGTPGVNGLRPDAYVKFGKVQVFIEVDMGTEWRNKITGKVQNYEALKGCPPVVFVVQDVARIKQLREWVEPLRKKVKVMYCTKRGLIKTLRRSL